MLNKRKTWKGDRNLQNASRDMGIVRSIKVFFREPITNGVWTAIGLPVETKRITVRWLNTLRNTAYRKTITFCFTIQYQSFDAIENSRGCLGSFKVFNIRWWVLMACAKTGVTCASWFPQPEVRKFWLSHSLW